MLICWPVALNQCEPSAAPALRPRHAAPHQFGQFAGRPWQVAALAIVAGSLYVAVGSNDEVPGGKNKTDFYLGASLTGATVTIDGRPIIRKGTLAA